MHKLFVFDVVTCHQVGSVDAQYNTLMTTTQHAREIISVSAKSGYPVHDVFFPELHAVLCDLGDCCNSSNFGRYTREDGLGVYVVRSRLRGRAWEIHLVEYD